MDAFQECESCAFIPYVDAPHEVSIPEPALTLKNTSSWTYCGPHLHPATNALPPSFHKWASLTVSHPDKLLDRLLPLLSFLQRFLLEAGIQHCWLTIRATKSTHEYDAPRWHVDDDFFAAGFGRLMRNAGDSNDDRNKRGMCKLATAILGPPTLFLEDNESALRILRTTKAHERTTHQHECTSIRCLGCSTYADSVRKSLATALENHAIVSPQRNEFAVFRLGDSDGAVHSEPKCDVDRIFVNVVPGTEEELRALMIRWGMHFPRAWCLGVPGGLVPSDECETFAQDV